MRKNIILTMILGVGLIVLSGCASNIHERTPPEKAIDTIFTPVCVLLAC